MLAFVGCVIVYVLLIVCVVAPYHGDFVMVGSNIGNMLVDYAVTRSVPGTAASRTAYHSQNPEIDAFFARLMARPWRVSDAARHVLHSDYGAGKMFAYHIARFYAGRKNDIAFCDWWDFHGNRKALDFWRHIGTEYRRTLSDALGEDPLATPDPGVVVHLRCSDIPFIEKRNQKSVYHLQTTEYYDWAFRTLRITTAEPVTILASHRHRSQSANETCCNTWSAQLARYLESRGFAVSIVSDGSVMRDFAALFRAKKAVGSTSSFAFTASIGKCENPECGDESHAHFVMPMLGCEFAPPASTYHEVPGRPAWMCSRPGLLHRNVSDYYDTANVSRLLGLVA